MKIIDQWKRILNCCYRKFSIEAHNWISNQKKWAIQYDNLTYKEKVHIVTIVRHKFQSVIKIHYNDITLCFLSTQFICGWRQSNAEV